jgi:tyrosine-protein phosphatase SIW14
MTLAKIVLVSGLCFSASLSAADIPEIPNFHPVNDHIYRSGHVPPAGYKALAKLGVKTIVDLRVVDMEEAAAAQAVGIQYANIPMDGLSAPSNDQITQVLAILDDSSKWPVLVHCRRGKDRTGTVVACYRIAHDRWDNEKALKEAKSYGMSRLERSMQKYILSFQPPAGHPVASVIK